MTPTARALKECKARGYVAQVVERWNWHAKKRVDLFGCFDIVAITPSRDSVIHQHSPCVVATLGEMGHIIGIQVTTGTNHAARIAKIKAEPRMAAWAKAGGLVWVWSFAKRGAQGKRKTWTLRETEVVL